MIGSDGADVLLMTDFAEQVSGDDGDDIIVGRGGDDALVGGYGDDRLAGGPGDDTLTGNIDISGRPDQFVFDEPLDIAGIDHITDFSGRSQAYGERDEIMLNADVFTALSGTDKLKAKYLDIGNRKADDKNDFLIYHKKSGGVYYDADGSRKAVDPVQFAILDGRPKLSHKDFAVFDDA